MVSTVHKMILHLCVLLLCFLVSPLATSPPCTEYGGCRHYPFLPAPPGKTPPCAKHGATFCEKVDRYPAHLIRYLVEHWGYDFSTLLSDESRNEFKPKSPAPYGPSNYGYNYGPQNPPQLAFYPQQTPVASNAINYTQTEGYPYPDRRYPLIQPQPYLTDDPGFIYSALLQPDVTHYNPADWWKRYARSEDGAQKKRSKRQAAGGDTQLCPTRSQFVMPRAALNSQGNWMYVVNLERDQNRFTQQVRSETCISNQCNGLCTLPNGYTSRCEQQYVQKRLVALEGRGNNLYTDTFWFPHCCICQITQTN